MSSGGNTASATGRVIIESSDIVSSEYKVTLPRLPTGNLVLNSVFLHADMTARPYNAPDFRDALKDVLDLKDIKATGQFQMGHVWMVTCVNALAKEKLCRRGELLVKGKKCLVIDPNTRDLKIKLLWLPDHLEDRRIVDALTPFGVVHNIQREKWRCPGMEHMDTLNREVNITMHEGMTIERIPHLLPVFGIQTLVIVPGRPPLCLRCNRVGHIRRQCRTPRCFKCGIYGHIADTCVTTYASKLRGKVSRETEEQSELLMDVSEIVDASGQAPSAATFEKCTERELPVAVPSTNQAKDDPGGLPEPPPPPGEDDTSSTTSESTITAEDAASRDQALVEVDSEPDVSGSSVEPLQPTQMPEAVFEADPDNIPSADVTAPTRAIKERKQAGTRHKPYSKPSANLKVIEDSQSGNLSTP
ncbi:uncharacterized protein ISCGN_022403 [Ixodes scapularis]